MFCVGTNLDIVTSVSSAVHRTNGTIVLKLEILYENFKPGGTEFRIKEC